MMKEIDITGPEGNAFSLIGYAKRFAKQLNMDAKAIADEMMAGIMITYLMYSRSTLDLMLNWLGGTMTKKVCYRCKHYRNKHRVVLQKLSC